MAVAHHLLPCLLILLSTASAGAQDASQPQVPESARVVRDGDSKPELVVNPNARRERVDDPLTPEQAHYTSIIRFPIVDLSQRQRFRVAFSGLQRSTFDLLLFTQNPNGIRKISEAKPRILLKILHEDQVLYSMDTRVELEEGNAWLEEYSDDAKGWVFRRSVRLSNDLDHLRDVGVRTQCQLL